MNIIQKKKGVSEVVSVVLIIMITVAAIAVLWTIVIPMINDSIKTGRGCFDAAADVTLVQDTGYTCIKRTGLVCPTAFPENATGICVAVNSSTTSKVSDNLGNISIQIKKGSDPKVDLKAIQVIISLPSGNSDSVTINETMPALNAVKTYTIANSSYANATEISIAPILLMGKTTRTCDATQKAALVVCEF